MHDPWTDRLSEYLDRELSPTEAQQLESHLDVCAACRLTLAELRAVVATADELIDAPPQRDLWSGIAARLGESTTPASEAVVPIRLHPARSKRFSFSAPQLAAAAMLLMALSGSAAWFIAEQADEPQLATGTIVQSAGSAATSTRTVAAPAEQPAYDADIAALERTLAENRNQLDPATIEVVEGSIDAIDRAIAAARAALADDPGNPYLHRKLDSTMRKKIDILQHATSVRRAGS